MFNIKGKLYRKHLNLAFSERNLSSWKKEWENYGFDFVFIQEVFSDINEIMGWKNFYFFPSDLFCDIIFNPYSDFRDVEAIEILERKYSVILVDKLKKNFFMADLINDIVRV